MYARHRFIPLTFVIFILIAVLMACGEITSSDSTNSSTSALSPNSSTSALQTLQSCVQMQATVQYKNGTVTIEDNLGETWDNGTFILLGKEHTFDAFQSVYGCNVYVASATINIQGPVTNAYGHTSTITLMTATLTLQTEQMFVWSNLDQNSAWKVYDNIWISPILSNGQ